MIALHDFNYLPEKEALALLTPCVALPGWAEALVYGRPYPSRSELTIAAQALMQRWDEASLAQALSAHPRIGEKPAGEEVEAALSRQEQGAVNDRDAALAQALREGNARYEARFGRVFLIRAKGRSGEDILQILNARLKNSDAQEIHAALEQLREITLLRLEGVIHE
ncbi:MULTISPECIES: 2-oxo-4-hydroxy-4-carboxy-5-ureidoimidazoline decarboxylase [Enterobacter]|uniref:2-oxo-4-hydroxy-4-carboxy-5-ureidoimidazoline decarboxylase n=1 Tax=Enterobacter TaxID=547 RepID=UPI001866F3A5|nr:MULTISPECIES: 2-oxo-4-hydroxy-4-carboxy-5-ureidoimidazoline decarboxylase [Enterobacter]MBE3328105.1 2-oxo-4-hydroxy-4-carboxy-5-ureidoimidazoline decarboxylase [Enterobacter cloacae complex sp. P27C]